MKNYFSACLFLLTLSPFSIALPFMDSEVPALQSPLFSTLLPGLGDSFESTQATLEKLLPSEKKYLLNQLATNVAGLSRGSSFSKKEMKDVDTLIEQLKNAALSRLGISSSQATQVESQVKRLATDIHDASDLLKIIEKDVSSQQWFYTQRQSNGGKETGVEPTTLPPYLIHLAEMVREKIKADLAPAELDSLEDIIESLKAPLETLRYRNASQAFYSLENRISSRMTEQKYDALKLQDAVYSLHNLHEDIARAVITIESFPSLFISHHDNTPSLTSILNYERGIAKTIHEVPASSGHRAALGILFPNTEIETNEAAKSLRLFVNVPLVVDLFNRESHAFIHTLQMRNEQQKSLGAVKTALAALKKSSVAPHYKESLKAAVKQMNDYINLLKRAMGEREKIVKSEKLNWLLRKGDYTSEYSLPRVVSFNQLFPQILQDLNDVHTSLSEFMVGNTESLFLGCVNLLKHSVGTMKYRNLADQIAALKNAIEKTPSLKVEEQSKKQRLKALDRVRDKIATARTLLERNHVLFLPARDARFDGMRQLIKLEIDYADVLAPVVYTHGLIGAAVHAARVAAYNKKLSQIILESVSPHSME